MQGFIMVSFLYDTLRTLRAKVVPVPLTDSRSPLDIRLKTAIEQEAAEAKKNGWTQLSHATTLVPKLVGEDAQRVPQFLFEVTAVKGTDRKCETEQVAAYTHGLEVERRVENALIRMAELAKGKGYRPIGHTVTFVVC